DLLTIPGEAFDLGGRYCVFKEVRYGTYSLAGIHNVSVSDEYKIIALDNLQVGNLLLRSPEMSVVAQTDISILGLDILKYGMMHIDYRSAKMSFTPYTSDPVFEQKINFPGFSIGRENKMYVINGLEYGSEADRAGLKTGMQITKMAGLNLATYSAEKDCRILKKEFSKRKWLTVEYIDLRGRKRSVMLIRPAKEKKRPLLNSKV
ncbi:MAG: PDZ domain-containing protein, partial [Chitinophagaceae bacterium]